MLKKPYPYLLSCPSQGIRSKANPIKVHEEGVVKHRKQKRECSNSFFFVYGLQPRRFETKG